MNQIFDVKEPDSSEIYDSIPFFNALLSSAEQEIIEMRDEELEEQEKGRFPNGGIDYVTRIDIEVGNLYQKALQKRFPGWDYIIEDVSEHLSPTSSGPILVTVDPLDGTNLLKRRQDGYSTMLSVSVQTSQGYVPILGMVKIIGGDYLFGYKTDQKAESNKPKTPQKPQRPLEELVLGRSNIDRSGLLTRACDTLGCTIRNIGGVGPKTKAFVDSEIDLFLYDPPGIRFWDAYPIIPIIRVHEGIIFNWAGDTPIYNGTSTACEGFVAIKPYIQKTEITKKLRQVRLINE